MQNLFTAKLCEASAAIARAAFGLASVLQGARPIRVRLHKTYRAAGAPGTVYFGNPSGNGTHNGILVAAANGAATDFGGCPARRTGAERKRNSSSTAAPPQESNLQDIGTAGMAEAFVTAIREALTTNAYGT